MPSGILMISGEAGFLFSHEPTPYSTLKDLHASLFCDETSTQESYTSVSLLYYIRAFCLILAQLGLPRCLSVSTSCGPRLIPPGTTLPGLELHRVQHGKCVTREAS